MNDPQAAARLLLVDDDSLLRSMASRTLVHAGFEVSEAASGEAALLQFSEQPCDLVLLDLVMPGLDGYEVCQRIRAMPHGARVPILILTGLNDTGSIEHAYRHGATDFITKPINWTLLSHRVRYALRAGSAAEAMRHSSESLTRTQSLAGIGSWVAFPDGRIECSSELLNLYHAAADRQWTAGDSIGRVDLADRARVIDARRGMSIDGKPYQLEFGVERLDGASRRMFELATPVFDERGRLKCFEGFTQDITERVQAAERIRQLAHYDETTGLPNRQFFSELARPTLDRAVRNGSSCAVLHADIDRFTSINDAFGRGQGDVILKTVAERLRSWIRGSDLASVGVAVGEPGVVARVGGNAFTLLISDLSGQEQATLVADRLLKALAEPIAVESQALVLTASIGIAFFPGDAKDLAGLTRCAEQAFVTAKAAGRAQHRFFDEKMNAHAASRLQLETDLRAGIADGQLRLYFQPKVDGRSGLIVGAEALVRWLHPRRGLVQPGEFITLAEETGLVGPLTDWVLEEACRNLRAWAYAGLPSLPISVNLAASSLTGTVLVEQLDALMERFRLAPTSLVLEMTESVLMRDVDSGIALMECLRARGYAMSLDDFGTGYSSLSYLKRFPLDELKIDRAFVIDAACGGRDGALAGAVIAIGRELGFQIVAEGVETKEQAAFLLGRGCHLHQGFLYSRPVPAETFEQLVRAGSLLQAVPA